MGIDYTRIFPPGYIPGNEKLTRARIGASTSGLFIWTRPYTALGCATCQTHGGELRTGAEWINADVWPAHNTICGHYCKCTLVRIRPTDLTPAPIVPPAYQQQEPTAPPIGIDLLDADRLVLALRRRALDLPADVVRRLLAKFTAYYAPAAGPQLARLDPDILASWFLTHYYDDDEKAERELDQSLNQPVDPEPLLPTD